MVLHYRVLMLAKERYATSAACYGAIKRYYLLADFSLQADILFIFPPYHRFYAPPSNSDIHDAASSPSRRCPSRRRRG